MNLKNLFKSLTMASLLVTSLTMGSLSTEARLPDITVDPKTVPVDRVESFVAYFSYGSATLDQDIENAVAEVNIVGDGLELVTNGFADLFNGEPTRSDFENAPEQPVCSRDYDGPSYKISPSLATTTNLTYGLQSAFVQQANGFGGASTVDRLRANHTGCIRVEIRVSDTAEVGDEVEAIFDQDAGNSPTYLEDSRPGRQVLQFTIGEPTNPVSSSSSSSSVSSVTPLEETIEDTTRSGGFEIFAFLSFTALIGGFWTAYNGRKKGINRIDI